MPVESFDLQNALYQIKRNPNIESPESPTFDEICASIKSSEVYADPTCEVSITDDTIYFGHSFYEIIRFFPELKKLFIGSILRYLNNVDEMENAMTHFTPEDAMSYKARGINASDYRYETGTEMSPTKKATQRREELVKKARQTTDFMALKKNESEQNPSVNNHITLEEVPDLLNEHRAINIVEEHNNLYPKKLLIDNMKKYQEKGISVIFLEHVFSNTQSQIFESYFLSDNLNPPLILRKYISDYLDNSFDLVNKNGKSNPYSFLGLVIQAKRYGIKIIPIDTDTSYCLNPNRRISNDGDNDNRCLMMNFLAYEQIRSYEQDFPENKYITFSGEKHANAALSGIPGLQEITGCPVIIAQDSNRYLQVCEELGAEYLISGRPDLSEEAKVLQDIMISFSDKPLKNEDQHSNIIIIEKTIENPVNYQSMVNTLNAIIKELKKKPLRYQPLTSLFKNTLLLVTEDKHDERRQTAAIKNLSKHLEAKFRETAQPQMQVDILNLLGRFDLQRATELQSSITTEYCPPLEGAKHENQRRCLIS